MFNVVEGYSPETSSTETIGFKRDSVSTLCQEHPNPSKNSIREEGLNQNDQ